MKPKYYYYIIFLTKTSIERKHVMRNFDKIIILLSEIIFREITFSRYIFHEIDNSGKIIIGFIQNIETFWTNLRPLIGHGYVWCSRSTKSVESSSLIITKTKKINNKYN